MMHGNSNIKFGFENCAQASDTFVVFITVRDDILQPHETTRAVIILLYILILKFLMSQKKIKFLNPTIENIS